MLVATRSRLRARSGSRPDAARPWRATSFYFCPTPLSVSAALRPAALGVYDVTPCCPPIAAYSLDPYSSRRWKPSVRDASAKVDRAVEAATFAPNRLARLAQTACPYWSSVSCSALRDARRPSSADGSARNRFVTRTPGLSHGDADPSPGEDLAPRCWLLGNPWAPAPFNPGVARCPNTKQCSPLPQFARSIRSDSASTPANRRCTRREGLIVTTVPRNGSRRPGGGRAGVVGIRGSLFGVRG